MTTSPSEPEAEAPRTPRPVEEIRHWCDEKIAEATQEQPRTFQDFQAKHIALGYFKGISVGWNQCWPVVWELAHTLGKAEGRKAAAEAAYAASKVRFKEAWAEGGKVVIGFAVGIFALGMLIGRALAP